MTLSDELHILAIGWGGFLCSFVASAGSGAGAGARSEVVETEGLMRKCALPVEDGFICLAEDV